MVGKLRVRKRRRLLACAHALRAGDQLEARALGVARTVVRLCGVAERGALVDAHEADRLRGRRRLPGGVSGRRRVVLLVGIGLGGDPRGARLAGPERQANPLRPGRRDLRGSLRPRPKCIPQRGPWHRVPDRTRSSDRDLQVLQRISRERQRESPPRRAVSPATRCFRERTRRRVACRRAAIAMTVSPHAAWSSGSFCSAKSACCAGQFQIATNARRVSTAKARSRHSRRTARRRGQIRAAADDERRSAGSGRLIRAGA